MRIVDTSAWIEWLLASRAGAQIRPLLPRREEWLVPTIVQLELAKWMAREAGEDRTEQVVGFTMKCRIVALDTTLAIAAAEMSARHRLATADAIIYATAEHWNADILTCDAHFEGLPRTVLVTKRGH